MEGVRSAIGQAVRGIVDFALPPRCPGCGRIVEDAHRFCLPCWESLTFLGTPCCERCGFPFEYGETGRAECGACLARPPYFDRLRSAVAYGEVARQVVLRLKYSGRPALARTFAHFMARHLTPADEGGLIVPVPLHRWRIWKRGYNQSALIASALAARSGIAVELDLLRRARATPVLRGMNGRERARAVRGAFRVTDRGKAALKGRRILLVDDVYTSGATANACAKALKRAGAAEVRILCWARVVAKD